VRSGFATVVGRPNVGKSTLINAMVGTKVSIVSPRPNTTRHNVRGILHLPDAQVVLVDTPGLHRPRTALGERLNESAGAMLSDVDVVVAMVDATAAIGPGDRMVLGRALAACRRDGPALLVAVNKIDAAGPDDVMVRLATVAETVDRLADEAGVDTDGIEYFPTSATTGRGSTPSSRLWSSGSPKGPPTTPRTW
jgi:GTP-binding protein Era